jgi:hypothetical protein
MTDDNFTYIHAAYKQISTGHHYDEAPPLMKQHPLSKNLGRVVLAPQK